MENIELLIISINEYTKIYARLKVPVSCFKNYRED